MATSAPSLHLMRVKLLGLAVITTLLLGAPGVRAADRTLVTSDGVHLHITDVGPTQPPAKLQSARSSPVLVFIPGWTMPGWIFKPQIDAFSTTNRVVVLDPRGQGSSEIATSGYTYERRGEDVAELIASLAPARVVLIGWSLGVLDSLAYVHQHGDARLAGLVLIDNSIGEDPPPQPPRRPYHKLPPQTHAQFMAGFVRSMFHRPQPTEYLQRLTDAALRTPERAANQLLAYAVPRSYWKEAVYAATCPVFYIVRPAFAGQAGNLAAHHPQAETMVIPDLGHALFVDDAPRFNARLREFLARRVTP